MNGDKNKHLPCDAANTTGLSKPCTLQLSCFLFCFHKTYTCVLLVFSDWRSYGLLTHVNGILYDTESLSVFQTDPASRIINRRFLNPQSASGGICRLNAIV